jgi:hypothetical protein
MFNNSRPTIAEDKRDVLMDWVNQIESDLSDLYHNVEDDKTIQDDSFRSIEKQIESLYTKLNALRETIVFS